MKLNGLDISKVMFNGQQISKAVLNGVDVLKGMPSIVTDGLVLWLDGADFKNNPPTTLWLDKSGNGNHTTPYGFVYQTGSGSDELGGVVFDGTNDYCDLNKPLIPANNDFTVTLQCKFNELTQQVMLLGQFITGDVGRLLISKYMDEIRLQIGANYVYNPNKINKLDVNITITKSSGIYKMYNDGVLGKEQAVSQSILQVNTILGALTPTSNFGRVTVNKFLIYNRALTDAEILQNYNASK